MKKIFLAILAVAIVAAVPAFAGEWHAGTTNVCTDCHTMHFSMQHDWNSAATPSTTAAGRRATGLGVRPEHEIAQGPRQPALPVLP